MAGREPLPVVQEALTNALRHAAATRIAVSVRRNGREGIVAIYDDGHSCA
jgi:signal transduction histidine kinase